MDLKKGREGRWKSRKFKKYHRICNQIMIKILNPLFEIGSENGSFFTVQIGPDKGLISQWKLILMGSFYQIKSFIFFLSTWWVCTVIIGAATAITYVKGIVSRDFGGLQMILMGRIGSLMFRWRIIILKFFFHIVI